MLHLAPYWDAVVGVSAAVSREIASLAPGIEARQWTIPYGVTVPAEFRTSIPREGGRLLAAYAGRVVRFQKRALDLLSIARELEVRQQAVEITVAGVGTELMEFLEAAMPLVLTRHLRYVGGLTNEEVLRLLAASEVFVLPSSFEGLPISLLEAMAHGCVPVVTAIRSGVPEAIRDGENGFLVPVGDVRGFADRLTRLAGDPALLERMRRSAYETARDKYGIDRMVTAYLEVFESVVAQPFSRPKRGVKPPPGFSRIEAMMPRLPTPLRRVIWAVRRRRR
jgi:glycosyltransferase involved in cell wall biosynthesis